MTNATGTSRVSPGVPTGGQFAAQAHPDSGIGLVAETPALTAADATRYADRLIYSALSMTATSSACRDDASPAQAAYYAGNVGDRFRALVAAVNDGITNPATLRDVARGRLRRDDDGGCWYDTAEDFGV